MRIGMALLAGFLGITIVGAANAAISQPAPAVVRPLVTAQQWVGVYQGVLPCAACDEVRTQLVLQPNGHYVLHETWVAKTEILDARVDGRFQWSADRKQVILDKGGDLRRFLVGEGYVEERTAADGSPMRTHMSRAYVLRKVS